MTTLTYNKNTPHIIKYMGSKRQIIDFVLDAIFDVYSNGEICDLFAGSSVIAAALRNSVPIVSNDIQEYSSVIGRLFLSSYDWSLYPDILNKIVKTATERVELFKNKYPNISFDYSPDMTLNQINLIEQQQQELIQQDFSKIPFHLFVKYYSGTYWSAEQCIWIDVLRSIAEDYKNTSIYYVILSSLMFSMAYNSQSTGHYAQYRTATDESSKKDILFYRQKDIISYFRNKFVELQEELGINDLSSQHKVVTLDYLDCLDILKPGSTIYADPPYCFVHYSRFYHTLETLVKYDYPQVKFKGRYRIDRHQSPFCQRSNVKKSFLNLFKKVNSKKASLVLSYSNTGMISLEDLFQLAKNTFGEQYNMSIRYQEHIHSTMGRKDDKSRDVQECVILAKIK